MCHSRMPRVEGCRASHVQERTTSTERGRSPSSGKAEFPEQKPTEGINPGSLGRLVPFQGPTNLAGPPPGVEARLLTCDM